MRGVVIFGVQGTEANWARFYLEPVEVDGGDVNQTIRRAVGAGDGPGNAQDAQAPAGPAGGES